MISNFESSTTASATMLLIIQNRELEGRSLTQLLLRTELSEDEKNIVTAVMD